MTPLAEDPHPVSEVRSALLRQRDFGLLFWGQAVSTFGDRLVMVAMPFVVLSLPGARLRDVGFVLGATTLTLGLFVLVGGVVADRLPRQRVMLASDVVRGAAQAATAALLITDSATVGRLVALQVVYGAAEAFFRPAVLGLVPQVVGTRDVQPANALLGLSDNVALVAGPAVAGLLVVGVGPGGAIALDAATFLVSGLTLARLTVRREHETRQAEPFRAALAGGYAEVRSRSWVRLVLLAFCAYHAFVLPALFVLGPLVAEQSRGGAAAWGVISAGFGVGAMVGSLLALRWRPRRPGVVIGGGLMVSSTQAAIVAASLPTLVVAGLELLTGIAVAVVFTLWDTALQQRIPAQAQSRVSSFDYLASLALMPVGFLLVGPAAEELGTRTTAVLATVISLAVASMVASSPAVRSLHNSREGVAVPGG